MNVVVVENSQVIRDELISLLARQARLRVVGTASEEEEAVRVILAPGVDAVLLDLSLSAGSGMRVLERVREAGSGARVLVLTNEPAPELCVACLGLGAAGVFDKTADIDGCLARLLAWLPPLPANEARRLEQLHEMQLLGTPEQAAFRNLTQLAAEIAGTPTALISLVDADRQWFLARTGTEARETSRTVAFCAHTILEGDLMEIGDAREDRRFSDNPFVVGEPHVRFYAGLPLVLCSGEALGTLCVIDKRPRQLTPGQRQALKIIAGSVLTEIELRRRNLYLEQEAERRRAAEAQILHLATRDPITGLPNRASLRDRLDQHIRLALRRGGALGVLFIDLDRFKPINDTLGHDVGDEVLMSVAGRLSRCLRGSDIVARLGGDEFVVVLPEGGDAEEVTQVASKIIACLQEPIFARGYKLHLSASVGAALFPEHGRLSDELLRYADLAMYQAKRCGSGRICIYSARLGEQASQLQALEADLREGLHRRELVLHFQPQVLPGPGRFYGVEALVRWRHPQLGLLGPDQFIPLAERHGLIQELTRQVLDMAVAQLKAWDEAGLELPRVAVNVSPADLCPGFPAMAEATLARHAIAPGRLELEITESMLTADGSETLELLKGLRDLGVSIAVDDFGVGYSSLSQLHRLPIDTLKIDRSFVQGLGRSTADKAIVQALVTMAQALGLRTIAEGVEMASQSALLRHLGCHCLQGYFVARPMPGEEAASWMRAYAAGAGHAGHSSLQGQASA